MLEIDVMGERERIYFWHSHYFLRLTEISEYLVLILTSLFSPWKLDLPDDPIHLGDIL